MTFAIRMILIVTLMLSAAGALFAQETATPTVTSTSGSTAADTTAPAATETSEAGDTAAKPESEAPAPTSYDLRNQFTQIVRTYPSDVATVLVLDPTLMSNEQYMGGYPELARFIAAHPEIHRNPRFYLADFRAERNESRTEEILGPIMAFGGFALFAYGVAWLIRTFIEQKRWSRLSRTQTEVHNKILDRFGTSAELLEYVRSEAGTRFLESAPIPLHAERATPNTPMSRIMWSIQLGIVVVAASIGFALIGAIASGESSEVFLSMGAIAFCIGGGFIVSAFVSLFLSRRLGLWREPVSAAPLDEPGR